jgi:hypothetical protein
MESGEVLDLGELARQVAGSHGASDPALRRQRVADAGLFVRNDASRQRNVGTDVKSEYRREDEPTEVRGPV